MTSMPAASSSRGLRGRRAPCLALTGLLALGPQLTHAQGPPINTENAFVTGLNGVAFRTFFFAFDRRGLQVDGTNATDPLSRRVRGQVFIFPYELVSNRLIVMAVLPYLDKALEMGARDARRRLSVDGFGDLAIAAKLGIFQRDRPDRTTRAALFGRVKLPTGKDDAVGSDGQVLPRPLQLGTGSADYSAGIILTHSIGPVGLSGDLSYDFNTTTRGFAFGDVLHYDVAVGYRVHPRIYRTFPAKQINLYVEANGTSTHRDTLASRPAADSGGQVLLVSPGVQFIPSAGFLVEATYQIPVWQDFSGAQLEFQPIFKVGIRWLLF